MIGTTENITSPPQLSDADGKIIVVTFACHCSGSDGTAGKINYMSINIKRLLIYFDSSGLQVKHKSKLSHAESYDADEQQQNRGIQYIYLVACDCERVPMERGERFGFRAY